MYKGINFYSRGRFQTAYDVKWTIARRKPKTLHGFMKLGPVIFTVISTELASADINIHLLLLNVTSQLIIKYVIHFFSWFECPMCATNLSRHGPGPHCCCRGLPGLHHGSMQTGAKVGPKLCLVLLQIVRARLVGLQHRCQHTLQTRHVYLQGKH